MAGLYIHVPFCHSKCAYCDFYSRPCTTDYDYKRYVEAAKAEYSMRSAGYLADGKFSTVYIGGGTPSVLPADLLRELLAAVRPDVATEAEITIECNPEDVDSTKVGVWMDAGVNRVSMGIQSFSDSELAEVGRRHDAAGALRAYNTLRTSGVRNISLDLIYGLPGQTLKTWMESVDTLMDLHPEHFSSYALSVEQGTRLYARVLSGKFTPSDDELIQSMYAYLCEAAAAAGYDHYEISNFALAGMHSRHNSSYWRDEAYLGIGPSAVSFDGRNMRRTGSNNLKAYLQCDFSGSDVECESMDDRINDAILTGLRTSVGLDTAYIESLGGKNMVEAVLDKAQQFIDSGMLVSNGAGRLRIPESRWLLSDMVIRELFI